jgi:ligand-binding SRPBCC domain-containing protein
MIYKLHRQLEIKTSLSDAWDFFSNPRNLKDITPPSLNLVITSEVSTDIYPGMIITYSVEPLPSIPMTWVTEITHVVKNQMFVDEQRHGPYKMWHHQHWFKETKDGVLVEDIVDYIMPFGPIGALAHRLFVEKQLRKVFDFRNEYLVTRFGANVTERRAFSSMV